MKLQTTATRVLDYAHAPAIGFSFLGALAFGLCTLQKPVTLSVQEQWIYLCLMLAIHASYLIQGTYYIHMTKKGWISPQHDGIHILSSFLVWGLLITANLNTKSVQVWSYLGIFIVQVLFEVALRILSGISISAHDQLHSVPLNLGALRALLSVALMVQGCLFLRRLKKHSDEEAQPLLGSNGHGSIPSDEEDGDIKELQRKRLAEGGWFGYMKGFALFLPYLWPKDNRRVKICLSVRLIDIVLDRILNPLIPYQLGIITNKLVSGSGNVPWMDIGLWTLYRWLGSPSGFGILAGLATEYFNAYADKQIRIEAFGHIMSLSIDFHSNKDTSEVLKAVEQASSLTTLIELALFTIFPVLIDFIVAIWYISHFFDLYMAYIVLFIGIAYIWLGAFSTTRTQPKWRQYIEKVRHQHTTVYESVRNWVTVTYFNRIESEREQYHTALYSTISAKFSYIFRFYMGYILQDWLMIFGFSGCCTLAISQIVSGEKPVGHLVTLLTYWRTITGPLSSMASSYRALSVALINAERLLQILNVKPSVADNEMSQQLSGTSFRVEFKDVTFAYGDHLFLDNISFVADPGKKIAIVGESGGGKSTILKLIFRLYDVTSGSIMINGHDIRYFTLSSLRNAIGMVPQDPNLFNRSIIDNMRYASLGATDEAVMQACEAAAIHDTIVSFPKQYNSTVGEQGVKLSGGQQQRIAIAQALLQDAPILLLDEATSSVDSVTEAQIQHAFNSLTLKTIIVVAHRLSTISNADMILVVDGGKIIEKGTHQELLDQGGKYAKLWSMQTSR